MAVAKHLQVVLLAVSILLFGASRAFAQAPLEPPQMPARTTFYLIWRGAPSSDARKTNSLFSLWDDPDFAALRSGIVEGMISVSNRDKSKQALTREELEQYSTLLDNPFVLGYLSEPESRRTAKSAASTAKEHPWNGLFFVYDRTGKEALLAKAILRLRSQEKEIPQITQVSVGDVQVLKVQRKSEVTYWAETGKFAISANDRSVFEEILSRATGKSSESSSLAQSPAYQEARPLLNSGLLEFFLRVPDLKEFAGDSNVSGMRLKPALDSLKLESVHSIAAHISMEGAKTRLQGAILGDASTGTLFDIWAEGQQSPASLALLPADAVFYNEAQFNLPGIYDTVKRAVRSTLPQGQQGSADMLETMAQTRLGMPVTDALALPTGEFASLQTSPALDPALQVFILGIRRKPETLKLLHTVLAERISSEHSEGNTTSLKISLQSGGQNSGVAQWNFYYLAVTPDLLLGAKRSETLRDFLAQHGNAAGDGAGSIPAFQTARAQFPEKLNGFSFFDLQKLDWEALKARWLQEGKAALEKMKPAGGNGNAVGKIPAWLENADPAVFHRHLHSVIGASWKDAQGLHFDHWLE
jgi:hypothetical protein